MTRTTTKTTLTGVRGTPARPRSDDASQAATRWQPPDGVYRRRPGGAEYTEISTDLVLPGRFQPRSTFADAELEELANSIREHGILNRLKVFLNEDGDYELIAGERRLRAAKLVGLPGVPVEVCEYTLAQIHEISIIDNLQREGLTPAEEGRAYERMITELAISEAELSRRVGKPRAYIQQRRAIASAAPDVQQALAEGAITFSIARALATSAPGDVKIQAKACKELLVRLQRGNRVTEADASKEVERHVFAAAPKQLAALGWKVNKAWDGILVWSPADRPRYWTASEASEVIRAKRRPTSPSLIDTLVPPAKLSREDLAALETGYTVSKIDDWYCVQVGYSGTKQYLDAVEAADLAHTWSRTLAEVQERYVAGGWKLERTGSSWTATSPKQRRTYLSTWEEAGNLATAIDAGTAYDPDEPASTRRSAPKQKCARCKKATGIGGYFHDEGLCGSCLEIAVAEEKRAQAALLHALQMRYGAWISEAPIEALRLWVTMIAGPGTKINTYDKPAERRAKALVLDEPALRACFLGLLHSAAWQQRDSLAELGVDLPKEKEV